MLPFKKLNITTKPSANNFNLDKPKLKRHKAIFNSIFFSSQEGELFLYQSAANNKTKQNKETNFVLKSKL